MKPELNAHPDELEPTYPAHSRIAGLERLQSPALKNKILPWLGAVRDGDSESAISDLSVGQGPSTGPVRSARSAHALPPVRPLATASLSSEHAASSPPPQPAGTLGSPIKLPSIPRTPSRRHISISTGAHEDRHLHGEGTVVSEGSPWPADRSLGMTPASGTIPSIFAVLPPPSPLPAVPSVLDLDILRSQAQVRSQAGSKAPNVVPLPSKSTSSRSDTSFGNSPDVGKPTVSLSPLPPAPGRPERKTLPMRADKSTSILRSGLGKTSSMPFGVWGPPSGVVKQHRLAEDEVTQAPPDSPVEKPIFASLELPANHGTSPPQAPYSSTEPASSGPAREKDRSSTDTVTPASQPERPPRPSKPTPARAVSPPGSRPLYDWTASLFEDKVLCELLEFLGKPGVTTETRTMLMGLLAQRLSNLQTSSSQSSTAPTWAVALQHEVALLRQEILEKTTPTPRSPPSAHPSEADSFFAGPKGLLFQRDGQQPTPPLPAFASFGASSVAPEAVLPVLLPRVHSPARFNPLPSVPADSDPASLRIRVQPPSPAVDLSVERVSPTAVARAFKGPVGSSGSDFISAVTAATSPEEAGADRPTPQRTLPDAEQAVRDLVERSLPPTPPSEPDTLAPHDLAQTGSSRHAASVVRHTRPPTVASTFSEDPAFPKLPSPRPWDLVTQRLYAWAILWQDESFTRTLEEISLDAQVSSFALTIWTTVTYKRWLRSKICADHRDPVEKLFVPPSFADLLNKACFHRNYKDAAEILLGLWAPFHLDRLGESGMPRVIVALARHRNDDDAWACHRFDVAESAMTTWLFATGEQRLKDERTVSWWHVIRLAWPAACAKPPNEISQAVQHVILPSKEKHDVSLAAVNCFRNVLLGWRWDRATDRAKLRELVWSEVRRLFIRKSEGALVFEPTIDGGRVDDL